MKRLDPIFPTSVPEGLIAGYAAISPVKRSQLSLLSEDEIKEFSSFNHEKRKAEFLSARKLVNELACLAHYEPFVLKKNSLGAPVGRTTNFNVNVSIAHTDKATCAALSKSYKLGIDMEPAFRELSDRLKARMVHPGEQAMLRKYHLPLVQLWTLKEAVSKLTGTGLRKNFNEICINRKNKCTFFVELHTHNVITIISTLYDDYYFSLAFL